MSEPSFVIIPRETLERAFTSAQAVSLLAKTAEETQELLDTALAHPEIQESVQEMVDKVVLGEVSLDDVLETLADSEEDEDA